MQKNINSFFCIIIFLQTHKNSHTTQPFYLSIYLLVLQLTWARKKLSIGLVRTEKKVLSLFPLILSFFFQTPKKKNANLFISNYVYLKFSVFDKTNIMLNISTDFKY